MGCTPQAVKLSQMQAEKAEQQGLYICNIQQTFYTSVQHADRNPL